MRKPGSGTLVVLLMLPVFLAVLASALWGRYLAQPGPLAAPASVVIASGDVAPTIAYKLAGAQVINHPYAFLAAVRVMGLTQTLKAGEYQFDPGISLRATINKLAMGDTENRAITIPEGFTMAQVLTLLTANNGLSGAPLEIREGHLFPDTYHFRLGTETAKLMETMRSRMDTELQKAWAGRASVLPYKTSEDLLILASMVQKEAANNAEMPQIAAVFVNRLMKGMKLQSDPTVIYGTNFKQGDKILKKDLAEPHPYNTYVFKGLPPTPIANPGRAALLAAANPAQNQSLYFVADPSRKNHVFSETYEEHRKNVSRYWQLVSQTALQPSLQVSATLPASVSATLISPATIVSTSRANPATR